jgi:hypothetical protein
MTDIFIAPELSDLFERCKEIENLPDRQLAIGSIITQVFIENGFNPPVLAGGMAVSVYSQGLYKTTDLDLLSHSEYFIKDVMKAFGYMKSGKDYYNVGLGSYAEFPSIKTDWSNDKVRKFQVEFTGLFLHIIGIEDLVLDRTASFEAGNKEDCREWALRLMGAFYKHIDWTYTHKRAHELGVLETLNKLQREVKRYTEKYQSITEQETSVSVDRHLKLF